MTAFLYSIWCQENNLPVSQMSVRIKNLNSYVYPLLFLKLTIPVSIPLSNKSSKCMNEQKNKFINAGQTDTVQQTVLEAAEEQSLPV